MPGGFCTLETSSAEKGYTFRFVQNKIPETYKPRPMYIVRLEVTPQNLTLVGSSTEAEHAAELSL